MMQVGLSVVACWQSQEPFVIEYASQESYPTSLKYYKRLSVSQEYITCTCTGSTVQYMYTHSHIYRQQIQTVVLSFRRKKHFQYIHVQVLLAVPVHYCE